mmetsp:Transcript_22289/g.56510  ORF Transcript_22289/g.56510 Transcript_22289/m.56510 type:complete len:303 (+) Transcript_22289:1280-2188(+)
MYRCVLRSIRPRAFTRSIAMRIVRPSEDDSMQLTGPSCSASSRNSEKSRGQTRSTPSTDPVMQKASVRCTAAIMVVCSWNTNSNARVSTRSCISLPEAVATKARRLETVLRALRPTPTSTAMATKASWLWPWSSATQWRSVPPLSRQKHTFSAPHDTRRFLSSSLPSSSSCGPAQNLRAATCCSVRFEAISFAAPPARTAEVSHSAITCRAPVSDPHAASSAPSAERASVHRSAACAQSTPTQQPEATSHRRTVGERPSWAEARSVCVPPQIESAHTRAVCPIRCRCAPVSISCSTSSEAAA